MAKVRATLFSAERMPFGGVPLTPARFVIARAAWVTVFAVPPALLLMMALVPVPQTPTGWLLLALAAIPVLFAAEYVGGHTFPGRIALRLTRPELRHLRLAYRMVLLSLWGAVAIAAALLTG
ncbi:MAG: hypothetical protein OEY97_10100 [Nitrospirota bacterium]|nr:hypothetical protein [Nitrospirota bacterium]